MADKTRYARMTDLWTPGKTVVLRPGLTPDESTDPPTGGEPPLLVWVQKLNQFEAEECRVDAEVARARAVMDLEDEASNAHRELESQARQMKPEDLVRVIVASQYTRHMSEAAGATQADPEWHAKLDIIERTDLSEVSDEEAAQVARLSQEYFAEIERRVEELDTDQRDRLESLSEDVLRKEYVEARIAGRGMDIFTREMRVGEILFGVRICDAVRCESLPTESHLDCGDRDSWHHRSCSHARLYDNRSEVLGLPDQLLGLYAASFQQIDVPVRLAKGSGSRPPSSAPSLPPSEQGESSPSTQTETSPEQATTSA